ncbi:MAG: hypothetical protein JWO06_323 [Bacteroidota bacterium]|nr:hypothetical protein [Bacteroidota bacterium]
MTHQLEKVIGDLTKLSTKEQDAIAELIQEELLWDFSLKNSSDKLSILAEEAR